MSEFIIRKTPYNIWLLMSLISLLFGSILLVFWGPKTFIWIIPAIIILPLINLFFCYQKEWPLGLAGVLTGFSFVLCIASFLLYNFFLSPLPDTSLKIPRFQYQYNDPQQAFSILGPKGWKYSPIISAFDSGVRIQPADKGLYMGVSETTVMIKRLESTPQKREEIFKLMLESQRDKSKKGEITIEMTPAILLDGEKGMWSIIEIKRFWFKIYQISLVGLKDNSHLCIVSATGLKSHDTLAKVLLQGLYRATKIKAPKIKNIATN